MKTSNETFRTSKHNNDTKTLAESISEIKKWLGGGERPNQPNQDDKK